ncbi:MAG: hypothetical protein KJ072_09475 [Verrucomicrobia bacterium]|nr:hypothetical protein [Verrucomicrobiota bacterium]
MRNPDIHPDLQGEPEPPLFAALQRADERAAMGEVAGGDVTVQLGFDEHGAWLEILDDKGRPQDPDYRAARGALRDLLKAMALIRRRQQDLVGWESSAERVYLHHHEHLLWPLRNCPALVGEDRRPLGFAPGTVEMVLELVPGPAQEPPWLTGRLLLVRDGEILAQADQFRFLNETHVLAGDRIYETPPVGENFARLPLFASSFPEAMLERCLSLFFSHFTGVTVRYRDYTTTPGEPLHARPSILFQNVDEAGELHFDLIHTLPGFSVDFTRKYDLTRVCLVHETEKTMVVREVAYAGLAEERQALCRSLNRHQKELGADAEAMVYVDEHGFIVGKELAARFLGHELSELARRYVLIGAEKLRAYRIKPVIPKLTLRLGFGIDFLHPERWHPGGHQPGLPGQALPVVQET